LRYLADKARHKDEDEKKRKARASQVEAEAVADIKRLKVQNERKEEQMAVRSIKALQAWCQDMDSGTEAMYKQLEGEDWRHVRDGELYGLVLHQETAFEKQKEPEDLHRQMKQNSTVTITGFKWI